MKRVFILSLILVVAGSFAANSAYSQVHVDVGIGVPAPPVVVYERDYPGYVYYTYPAWHGHYRDRYYYAHYRGTFEREHRAYFNDRHFDHERFEHDRGGHRGQGRGPVNRGHSDHGRGDHGHGDHGHGDHGRP